MKAISFALTRVKAERGDARAQRDIGLCYYSGHGVPQDYGEAVKWFRNSEEQGDESACHNLGLCYASGRGVAQDSKKAVKWWHQAAEQGDASSQACLFTCYEKGCIVNHDYVQAYKWCRLASTQGILLAKQFLPVLKHRMSALQRAAAKRLVREFNPQGNSVKTKANLLEYQTRI